MINYCMPGRYVRRFDQEDELLYRKAYGPRAERPIEN
jgi:hypothetical protein